MPKAAAYTAAVTGPSGSPFNYSDANGRRASGLLEAWNAYRGGDSLGAWATRRRLGDASAGPLHLLWQSGPGTPPARAAGPTGFFPRSGLVSMRTDWGREAT